MFVGFLLGTKPANSGTNSYGGGTTQLVGGSCNFSSAFTALPDTNYFTLDGSVTTKNTVKLGVLGDLDLLDNLTKGGTIPGSVFTGDADFLCAPTHFITVLFVLNE